LVSSVPLQFIAAPSTPNRNHKRGNRRVRQNKTPGSDTIRLTGRQTLATPPINQVVEAIETVSLNPTSVGDRVGSVANNFVRYRIKSLRLSYVTMQPSSSSALFTFGIQDDIPPSGGGTEVPTNRDQILNLRRATETTIWRNRSLGWSPLDRSKWYYVTPTQGLSEDRFSTQATVYYLITENAGGGEGPGLGFIDVQYVIEFSGATLTSLTSSSSLSSYIPVTPRPLPSQGEDRAVPGYVSISRPLMNLRK